MRLAIGVIGGLLIGGFLGAQLTSDLVMLSAPIGAGIGAWLATRGRKSPENDPGEWHDCEENQSFGGFFGGGDDDDGDDGGDDGGD